MKKNSQGIFNIRVYAIILNNRNEILISNEFHFDTPMFKLPGGGLIYGEGIADCIKREIKEECNQKLINLKHFYTTDFFQQAMFLENTQLISVYYLAEIENPDFFTQTIEHNIPINVKNGYQSLNWFNLESLNVDLFTFPIDRFVIERFLKINQLNNYF